MMKTKKPISVLLALLMALTLIPLSVFTASAQECIWSYYIGETWYSTAAALNAANIPGLKVEDGQLVLNNYEGTSIAARADGTIYDDDSPVLNILLVGDNKLTGGYFKYSTSDGLTVCGDTKVTGSDCFFGALVSEPRAGGYGDDSVINISGDGTLDITLAKSYSAKPRTIGGEFTIVETKSDVNIKGIFCGKLNVNGGKVTVTYGGAGVTAASAIGVEGDVNVFNSGVLDLKANIRSATAKANGRDKASSCAVYGVDGDVLSKSNKGYFSAELASVKTASADVIAVKGNVSYQNVIGALYLSAPAGKTTYAGTLTLGLGTWQEGIAYKKFAFSDTKYVYEAYGPADTDDLAYNPSLSEITVAEVKEEMTLPTFNEKKIYEETYTLKDKGFFMKELSFMCSRDDGQAYNNSTWANYEINDSDTVYELDAYVVPAAGRWLIPSAGAMAKSNVAAAFTSMTPDDAYGIGSAASTIGGFGIWFSYTAPNITKQPVNCDYIKGGSNPVFKVEATGKNLTYQWYWGSYSLNDGAIGGFSTTGGKTATLTIDGKNTSFGTWANWDVYCVVSTDYASVTSAKVKISEIEKPGFKTQPENCTVAPGSEATFKADFEKTDGVTYQWYTSDGTALSDSDAAMWKISGAKTNTLKVTPKTPAAYAKGNFFCRAAYKGISADSNTASVIAPHDCAASAVKVAAVAPTCTTAGNKEYYKCGKCGKLFADKDATKALTEKDVTIAALGHKWDNGVIVKEATESTKGIKKYTCTVCKATKNETYSYVKPTEPDFMYGDIDLDKKVTASDARLALRASVGLEKYEAGTVQFLAGNVDLDNAITSADARLILRFTVGLEKKLGK